MWTPLHLRDVEGAPRLRLIPRPPCQCGGSQCPQRSSQVFRGKPLVQTHTHAVMRTHIHTHAYMQTHTHIHVHTHAHPHTRAHAHTHTNKHTCVYTFVYTCTHEHTHSHMHTHVHMHVHVRAQICTHRHTHVQACARTYTQVRAHACAHAARGSPRGAGESREARARGFRGGGLGHALCFQSECWTERDARFPGWSANGDRDRDAALHASPRSPSLRTVCLPAVRRGRGDSGRGLLSLRVGPEQ